MFVYFLNICFFVVVLFGHLDKLVCKYLGQGYIFIITKIGDAKNINFYKIYSPVPGFGLG